MTQSIDKTLKTARRHAANGDIARAAQMYRQVLARFPANRRAMDGLKSLGAAPRAAPAQTGAPPQKEIAKLAQLYRQGSLAELVEQAGLLAGIYPDAAILYDMLATANIGLGRKEQAVENYTRLVALKPDDAQVHSNLGAALRSRGDLDGAIASFSSAIRLNPDLPEAHYNLGLAFKDRGDFPQAIDSYRVALRLKPDFPAAHSNLCEVYEKQNRLTELEAALQRAVSDCGSEHSEIVFRIAQLEIRKKEFAAARAHLETIRLDAIRPSLRSGYFNLLGMACDKTQDYDKAFNAFERQNELERENIKPNTVDADRYLAAIRARKQAWVSGPGPDWSGNDGGAVQSSPVFLVGFPRSGTTLLDTILRSHPDISVFEELPMVARVEEAFGREQTVEDLNALSQAEIRDLRDIYFRELDLNGDHPAPDRVIIDKLPLNISNIGLIHRIFPDSRFILALRHPCDCVLSCFMQVFGLNDAMANFLDLGRSAELYASTMELWQVYRDKLDLPVHVSKYEDLIKDFDGSCRALLAFLGLDWHENLENYRETAARRGVINTPSYSQVIQPIYKEASGRWTHYRAHMEPVLPVLRPWIDAFGY